MGMKAGISIALQRRRFLHTLVAAATLPTMAVAEDVIDLEWPDLMPQGTGAFQQTLQDLGIIEHDEITQIQPIQPQSSGVTNEFNGKIVRLPGYVVPLDTSGAGVTAFILVPYVGACIHVPPPPANQLVFVTTATPYEVSGMFEAVNVTGMFGTASTNTQLADISYVLSADKIEPFRG